VAERPLRNRPGLLEPIERERRHRQPSVRRLRQRQLPATPNVRAAPAESGLRRPGDVHDAFHAQVPSGVDGERFDVDAGRPRGVCSCARSADLRRILERLPFRGGSAGMRVDRVDPDRITLRGRRAVCERILRGHRGERVRGLRDAFPGGRGVRVAGRLRADRAHLRRRVLRSPGRVRRGVRRVSPVSAAPLLLPERHVRGTAGRRRNMQSERERGCLRPDRLADVQPR
jgi:hypothetical protein